MSHHVELVRQYARQRSSATAGLADQLYAKAHIGQAPISSRSKRQRLLTQIESGCAREMMPYGGRASAMKDTRNALAKTTYSMSANKITVAE